MFTPTAASARRSSRPPMAELEAPLSASQSARSESARRMRRNSEISYAATPTRQRGNNSRSGDIHTQGNAMKVYVRVRPYSERELAQASSTHSTIRIDAENPAHLTLLDPSKDFGSAGTYQFSRCFWSVFERSADSSDLQKNKTMNDMRETVDVYLNGGMNSTRRARAMSSAGMDRTPMSPMSGRGNSAAEVPTYLGSGSNAAMVDANVTHPPYSNQEEVYKFVGKPIVENTVDGYNGCVFAYGQTGSGKTFTMLGYAPQPADLRALRARRESEMAESSSTSQSSPTLGRAEDPLASMDDGEDVVNKAGMKPIDLQGIIPRAAVELFMGLRQKRKDNDSLSYRVEVSYYEIYNEKVYDLIKPDGEELKVGNNPITGPYVDGLSAKPVTSEEDVLRVVRKGMQERHTAQTKFNDRSSRSHAIITFTILQIYLDSVGSTTKLESKLNLVDLAGSERAGAAGVDRPEYKEGVNINLSLTVLGRVIDCLADLSKRKSLSVPVPYRDSRLTMLLMDSIGGNSQTSMVATVSPHMLNFEEMKQTIRYASRAKQIVNRAVRNEDPQVVYIRELKAEVEHLQKLLKEAGGHEFTRDYVLELEARVRELEARVAEQEHTIASLRAELESAGIADPTSSGAAQGSSTDARSGVELRQAAQSLQLQLDTANRELARLQQELKERAATAGSSKLQQEQAEKIKQLQARLDAQADGIRERDALLRNYSTFQMPWTTEIIFSTFEGKGQAIMRECRTLLAARSLQLDEAMNKGQMSGLAALNEQEKKHEQELNELAEQYRKQLADMEKIYEARDVDRQKKRAEAIAAVEAKLQDSISTYEQEKKRMGQERESMRQYYEDLLTKASLGHQDELKKLRETLGKPSNDRQKTADALRLQQEEAEQKLRKVTEELAEAQKHFETEMAKARSQASADAAKKEAALNDKDRQRREVERQLTAARQDNLRIIAEGKHNDKEKQEQLKDIVQKQEGLVVLACNALEAFDKDAPAALGSSMATLREYLADKSFSEFRQKSKDMAYRGNAATAAAEAAAKKAAAERKKQADDEREKLCRNTLLQMKKMSEQRNANMLKLQQDCYEQQSRIRGYQNNKGGEGQGENSTSLEMNSPTP